MGDPVSALTFGLAKKDTFANDLLRGDPMASGRRKEQKIMDETQRAKDEMERGIAARQKQEDDLAMNTALRERRRQTANSSRTNYGRGTILTSPIGAVGSPQSGGKTLLGS